MKQLFLVALAVLLTGCAAHTITAERPGRHEIGSSYFITTTRGWSRYAGPPEWRTIDGPTLGTLHTWADVADGRALFEIDGRTLPPFRSDFTAVEAAELVSDTIEALVAGADVQTLDLRPAAFGSHDGFRFELSYVNNGLPYKGVAAGSVHAGRLNLILFRAPAEYYFDRHFPEVDRVMRTVGART
jgi:hypothetical protein